jgi:hypothetical protein
LRDCSPIYREGWFVFSKCCPNRPIEKLIWTSLI